MATMMPPAPPPMVPPSQGPPISFGPISQARPILNRHRGMDNKKHGRGGNLGGLPSGPDFRPAGLPSTGRMP